MVSALETPASGCFIKNLGVRIFDRHSSPRRRLETTLAVNQVLIMSKAAVEYFMLLQDVNNIRIQSAGQAGTAACPCHERHNLYCGDLP